MKLKTIICPFCCEEFSRNHIGHHSRKHNQTLQEYYNQYFRKTDEGCCKHCKKPTKFVGFKKGYLSFCSNKCSLQSDSTKSKRIKTNIKNFGVENVFEAKQIKEKLKKTNIEKYGVENPSQSLEIKEKKKVSSLERFGVEYPISSSVVKEKIARTNMERYGVANVMHDAEIANRAILNGGSRASAKKYKTKFGNVILVQGTYEEKFVALCEQNNVFIENGPCICYSFNDKKHRYFVDFKIKTNEGFRLIEIKSSYWYGQQKNQIIAKKLAAEQWCLENNVLGYHLLIEEIKIPGANNV